jgi:hypothetical protein
MSLRSFTRAATAATQSLSLIGRASWQRQKRPPYHGHGDGAPQRRIDRGGKPPRRRPPRSTAHGEPVSSDYHNKNASRSIVDEIYCRRQRRQRPPPRAG